MHHKPARKDNFRQDQQWMKSVTFVAYYSHVVISYKPGIILNEEEEEESFDTICKSVL